MFAYLTLESYPLTGPVTAVRIGIAFVVLVSFPLLMQPCRLDHPST